MTPTFNDKVLSVVGAYETHKNTGEPYDTISVQQLMRVERTAVAKDQARWVLCSTYNQADGRSHKAQEQRGRFVMIAVDLDTGNVQGKKLVAAIQAFTGTAQMRVYASSSATKDERKWRALIPLAHEARHDEWLAVTVALNRHLEQQLGHRPDRALERAGQPIYLPNTAPRTDGVAPLTADTLVDGPLWSWRESPAADAILAVMVEDEERQHAHEQRAAEARRRMAQLRARPDSEKTVIQQFNDANDVAQMLAACGYREGPRGGWKSPRQTTASYATKVFDEPAGQYWVSLSGSDLEAGVGSRTADGRSCFGDSFDLFCFHMHGNDRTAAIRAAADQLGIKSEPSPVDMLAERIRRNQAQLAAAAPQPAHAADPFDVEFPAESAPAAAQAAAEVIERAATAATAAAAPASAPVLAEADAPEARTLPYVQANALPGWSAPAELVEGVLLQGGMAVVYGDSNAGKSFFVLDMAAHISIGRTWMGRRVQQCAVLYLAAESPRSIIDRSRALADHLGQQLPHLFITQCPIDLFDPAGDTLAVVNTVQEIERRHGVKIGLVIPDTWARVMGAGDENKAQDMGAVIKHCDLIRAATSAAIMGVHHTGKNKDNGARGSSALRAATDTEIEVSDPGDGTPRIAKITKQRDLPGKGEAIGFSLAVVELGKGVFGNDFTTCVVEPADASASDPADKLTAIQRDVVDFLRSRTPGSAKWGEVTAHMKTIRPGISDGTTGRALERLVKLNLAAKTLGMYAAIQPARAFSANASRDEF